MPFSNGFYNIFVTVSWFEKPLYFGRKKAFWKKHYNFRCILEYICCNLVLKILQLEIVHFARIVQLPITREKYNIIEVLIDTINYS